MEKYKPQMVVKNGDSYPMIESVNKNHRRKKTHPSLEPQINEKKLVNLGVTIPETEKKTKKRGENPHENW